MTPSNLFSYYIYSLIYFLFIIKAGCGAFIEECQLVKLLLAAQEDKEDIPHWVCLAKAVSGMNKKKVSQEPNKPASYGLFQIKGEEWCGVTSRGGLCGEICSNLAEDNLRPQIKCAQQVRSAKCYWGAWPVWIEKCQDSNLSDILHCLKK